MDRDEPDDAFARGVEQFNRREFFESHETWEVIWLAATEPDKTFLQGIVQVAAAFHHFQRGNRAGAASLLRQGVNKLKTFPTDYHNIRLESLRRSARRWLAALEAGESPDAESLPRIERCHTAGTKLE